ncbi:MAG: MarR family transcriptional regulator [Deltaproteobacteria bacterium]|jgi:DNA-binding MarR family transcriptional regulator|nr:MarR family transcriptional regulator [Deltaproteobacteria bacterium]MBT4091716.1 MarR family transcriptional regulator [Deltaproteobacteria bacterium]MBT4266763.1 MarR family transcriptional regulator [Deltaproteobacteria bacterium]MBT4643727.1 MarR family transcriptional regulator [Deltaproteobacteria bacterium]MBT6503287.1 MarR family transcriptional regulator [Deltaproteobacteria bacterium]
MEKRELIYIAVKKFHGLAHECNLELSDHLGMSELQLNQLHYLNIIDRTVGLTFTQFAELLKVTKPSVTEIINKLIRLNCVEKIQSPDDGRIFYIELTEKGRNIAQISSLAEQRVVDIILERFDNNEINTFVTLIKKL